MTFSKMPDLFLIAVVPHFGSNKVKVKVAQSSLTLCNPKDYTVRGILQARILEWVAVPFFRDQTQVFLIVDGFFTS